jgi:predicted secreted protein with PEFG-CTERM motif
LRIKVWYTVKEISKKGCNTLHSKYFVSQLNYLKHKYVQGKMPSLRNKLLGFMVFSIIIPGIIPVFASPAEILNSPDANSTFFNPIPSQGPISVLTDKTSYNDGDTVTIYGGIRDSIPGTPITVIIRNPIGNVVEVNQVNVTSGNTYSTTINAGGSNLWTIPGIYQVLVEYGSKDRTADTIFQFAGSTGRSVNTILVDNTNYTLKYSITNGTVLGIKADSMSKSLLVSIKTMGDGLLSITLPRGLIDSNSGGQDQPYSVVVNGVKENFVETRTTSTDRTLAIQFTDGTTQIGIQGTFVIPEFGPIAGVVLAFSLISIIVFTKKTGIKFLSRY